MVAILNTSLLTSYGSYTYRKLTKPEVMDILNTNEIVSYVRHADVPFIFKRDFNFDLPLNNALYEHKIGEQALIFKLQNKERFTTETELSTPEIDMIGYEIGLLTKTQ